MSTEAKKGRFIVFEGINGCGKGIVVDEFGKYFEEKGLKVFDLREYNKKYGDFPQPETIKDYDVILSAEPTHAWVGAAIRKELFYINGRDYSPEEMLAAYALDRDLLFKRVLIPMKKMGKIIVQERTVSTTVTIQGLSGNGVTLKMIADHPCHKYVMKNLPDTICVLDVEAEKAALWMNKREKKDVDQFERIEKQRMTQRNFMSEEFKKFFESRGTKVVYLKNDKTVEDLITDSKKMAKKLYEKVYPN
jgi:thymidylate kinase